MKITDLQNLIKKRSIGYTYITPLLIVLVVVLIYPILTSIFLSFQKVRIPQGLIPFKISTLKNYQKLFSSSDFYLSLYNTFFIVFFSSISSLFLGIVTAISVNRFKLFRGLAILPWAIPSVTAAVAWGWFFDGSFGLFNWVLVHLGILEKNIVWNQHPVGATIMVIVVFIWKGYPFICLMVLAALQSIPSSLYEAADIEGASDWTKTMKITLPLIKPTIIISGLLSTLWIFRDYPIIYLLTGGGPVGKTQTLAIMTYQQAFESFNMGYGAAVGVFTLLICFVLSYLVVGVRRNQKS